MTPTLALMARSWMYLVRVRIRARARVRVRLGLGLGSGPLALTVRGRAHSTLIEMARAAVRGGGFMT